MGPETMVFILAAAVVGGLTMGGVTWVYFLDKWREDPPSSSAEAGEKAPYVSPFELTG